MKPSNRTHKSGQAISATRFTPRGWLQVRNDGGDAPGTFLAAKLQNDAYPHIFYSNNMQKYFGTYAGAMAGDGVPIAPFNRPWWYRTEFVAHPLSGQHTTLDLHGIIPAADVWLNGRLVASHTEDPGAFATYTYDVTRLLRAGPNAIAFLVYPNNPRADLAVDSVDWSESPPDNNAGIQFPIQLHTTGSVSISDLHTLQSDTPDFSHARIAVRAALTNHTAGVQTVTLRGTIGPINVARTVDVAPGATTIVSFAPNRYPQLVMDHPRVWWPYQMGPQPLYHVKLRAAVHGVVSDRAETSFGVRTVTSHLTAATLKAPTGVRQFVVNGRPFVVRGGGWAEDLFLRYSRKDTARQIAHIKNLGLNAVRIEGDFMPDDWYDQMDRAGILVMVGFECCDKWESAITRDPLLNVVSPPEPTDTWMPADYATARNSAYSQASRLGDHPGVFAFFIGSDIAPVPTQTRVYLQGLRAADWQQPIVSAVSDQPAPPLGFSGVKEGPYDWVPPNYFCDQNSDPSPLLPLDYDGAAWGFDAEESAGNTIPTIDSLRRFMSPSDLATLWRKPSADQYHANEVSNRTLQSLDTALATRYGQWSGLRQYVEEAQAINYETARAQFEAFIANSHDRTPATGTIYWMLNKGWPSLLWFLYNKDGDQPGAYFGAQEANRSEHVLYDYCTGSVVIDNLSGRARSGLRVKAVVHNINGTVGFSASSAATTLPSQGVRTALHPNLPANTSQTYFLELTMRRAGHVIDRNVYWLSRTPDTINWLLAAAPASPLAPPVTSYANLTALRDLHHAQVRARVASTTHRGIVRTVVTVTNTSAAHTVAFLVRADIRRGSRHGVPLRGDNDVRRVTWSTNDVTLWPGQSQTLTADYPLSTLHGRAPIASVSGWNITTKNISAVPR